MFYGTLYEKSLVSGNFAVRIGMVQDEDRIRIFFLPIIRHLSGKKIRKHILRRCYETFTASIQIQYI